MNEDSSSEKWPLIAEAFFRRSRPKPPTPFETEAFVSRLMGRLEEEEALPFMEACRQALSGMMAPALGLSLGALILSLFLGRPDSWIPADVQLLAGGQEFLGPVLEEL